MSSLWSFCKRNRLPGWYAVCVFQQKVEFFSQVSWEPRGVRKEIQYCIDILEQYSFPVVILLFSSKFFSQYQDQLGSVIHCQNENCKNHSLYWTPNFLLPVMWKYESLNFRHYSSQKIWVQLIQWRTYFFTSFVIDGQICQTWDKCLGLNNVSSRWPIESWRHIGITFYVFGQRCYWKSW